MAVLACFQLSHHSSSRFWRRIQVRSLNSQWWWASWTSENSCPAMIILVMMNTTTKHQYQYMHLKCAQANWFQAVQWEYTNSTNSYSTYTHNLATPQPHWIAHCDAQPGSVMVAHSWRVWVWHENRILVQVTYILTEHSQAQQQPDGRANKRLD